MAASAARAGPTTRSPAALIRASRPGQLTRFASLFAVETSGAPARAPRAGPLLFAGEHISDAFAGFMNGALQTGRIAAEALLAEGANRTAA